MQSLTEEDMTSCGDSDAPEAGGAAELVQMRLNTTAVLQMPDLGLGFKSPSFNFHASQNCESNNKPPTVGTKLQALTRLSFLKTPIVLPMQPFKVIQKHIDFNVIVLQLNKNSA